MVVFHVLANLFSKLFASDVLYVEKGKAGLNVILFLSFFTLNVSIWSSKCMHMSTKMISSSLIFIYLFLYFHLYIISSLLYVRCTPNDSGIFMHLRTMKIRVSLSNRTFSLEASTSVYMELCHSCIFSHKTRIVAP